MSEPSNASQPQWFYAQFGQQHGPVPLETLRDLLAARQVSGEDLVWTEGMPEWLPAGSVPELAGAIGGAGQQAPPMSVPPPPAPGGYSVPTAGYAPPPPPGYPPGGMPPPPGTAGYPNPVAYGAPAQADQSGKATTSMWLGISSIALGLCCPLVGIGLGIAALVVGNKVNDPALLGKAKTGRICGIIGIVISIINAFVGIAFNINNLRGGGGGNIGF